ncbi:hypothetical protein M9Y10_016300 [Tritrichomonas musculus]|uniref:Peptidase C14 caspase domain-containing protein n=1 Tax=Tritrichomonas musculus TaxID=1915356 RepID=A0ABR2HW44_9EUKA
MSCHYVILFSHHNQPMSDPTRRLKEYGRDLGSIPISRIPKEMEKVCFICVNTYTSYRLNLGTGPINDAVSFAKCLKQYDYEIFFQNNPHSRNFLKYLDEFFKNTTNELVLYYVGHGTSLLDLDEDSDPTKDAFIFDDGKIAQDTLVDHISQYKNPNQKLVLVNDSCYPGSIWDIKDAGSFPPNIMSLCASADSQTAKLQTLVNAQEAGIFTHNMTKILKKNPSMTPRELQAQMKPILRKYQQTFSIGSSTPEILDEPLFE